MSKKDSKRLSIILLIIISVAIYLNTLQNGFVYDDQFVIIKNKWIRNFGYGYLKDMLFSSTWSFLEGEKADTYRPLLHLTYMLEYSLFGLKPWGYHLINILTHALNSILVFFIALYLFSISKLRTRNFIWTAFIAALLFATHPIHTEAVAWVTTIVELAMTAFFLASFFLYMRSSRDSTMQPVLEAEHVSDQQQIYYIHYVFSVLFFFIALLFKEVAITLPMIILLYDFSRGGFKYVCRKFRRYIPYAIVIIIYFMLRLYALEGLAVKDNIGSKGLSNYQVLINIFPLFSQHLGKLILPVNLKMHYFFDPVYAFTDVKALFGIFVTTVFFVLLYLLKRTDTNLPFFCLSFILIPLLPTFYLRGLPGYAFAERFLYLPSVGFAILISYVLSSVYHINFFGRKWSNLASSGLYLFLFLTVMSYSVATITRNRVWKSDLTLWKDVAQKSPDNPAAHYSLGVLYKEMGKLPEAIQEYETVLKLNASIEKTKAHNNLGNIYFDQGNLQKAIYHFKEALQLNSNDALTHNNLGLVYVQTGDIEEGVEEYLKALQIKPKYPEAHHNLGLIYFRKGQLDAAIAEFKKALELSKELEITNPSHLATIHENLGLVYESKSLFDNAITHFEMSLSLLPGNIDIYNRLGIIYASKGDLDKAILQFRRVLEIDPGHKGAAANLRRAIGLKQE